MFSSTCSNIAAHAQYATLNTIRVQQRKRYGLFIFYTLANVLLARYMFAHKIRFCFCARGKLTIFYVHIVDNLFMVIMKGVLCAAYTFYRRLLFIIVASFRAGNTTPSRTDEEKTWWRVIEHTFLNALVIYIKS